MFTRYHKDPILQKFSPSILFYNMENEEILKKLLKGNKFINHILILIN